MRKCRRIAYADKGPRLASDLDVDPTKAGLREGRMRMSANYRWNPGRALTVCEVCALSDLDNVSVRISDIAARLAVLGNRRRYELCSSTFP